MRWWPDGVRNDLDAFDPKVGFIATGIFSCNAVQLFKYERNVGLWRTYLATL